MRSTSDNVRSPKANELGNDIVSAGLFHLDDLQPLLIEIVQGKVVAIEVVETWCFPIEPLADLRLESRSARDAMGE